MARECKIKTTGGQVTVQLSVDNGIISGGDFALYDFDSGIKVHSFKMHTSTTGVVTHIIPMDAKEVLGKVLSWEILSCSPIVTDTCDLDIEIIQDDKKCPMNKPAHYALKDVPNCAIGQALPVKGGLHFVKQLTPEA
jgi:hypothetical protein